MSVTVVAAGSDIFLKPGDWFFGQGHVRIKTILGSCVAMTVWHPVLKEGGMCHFMLPRRLKSSAKAQLDGRYGDEAFQLLTQAAMKKAPIQEYQIKLFGGSVQLQSQGKGRLVAQQNVQMAYQLIEDANLSILAEDVGREGYHRQVVLDLATGHVWVKRRVRAK